MFITFEGPEGSGKTSQVPLLADFLRQNGFRTVITREPGGTLIGDQIRAVLHDLKNITMHPRTEVLLLQASRAQLVEEFILPHLRAGDIVLCDRYADSTRSYQGFGHKLGMDQVDPLIRFATGGLIPDLTLLLDIDVEEGLRRRAQGGEWNRLDAYDLEFHQRVRAGYAILAQTEPLRWMTIDASQPFDQVQTAIQKAVMSRLAITRDSS